MDCQDTDAKWYVLRVTYQRELSTKEYLDKLHVENFVPVRVVRRRDSKGRFSRVREAAVHNYITLFFIIYFLLSISRTPGPSWLG